MPPIALNVLPRVLATWGMLEATFFNRRRVAESVETLDVAVNEDSEALLPGTPSSMLDCKSSPLPIVFVSLDDEYEHLFALIGVVIFDVIIILDGRSYIDDAST